MDDPKEANRNIPNSVLYVRKVNIPIVIIENIPASNDFFIFKFSILSYLTYS